MNDAERDAWLREALRHTPDSGALPPSEVSATILAQARAAARTTRSPPRGATSMPAVGSLAALWAWLARPPVAAGFASVMAATLVGLMWWDQPMDETLPPPPAAQTRGELAQAPAATVVQAPAAAPSLDAMAPAAANRKDSSAPKQRDDARARPSRPAEAAPEAKAPPAGAAPDTKTAPATATPDANVAEAAPNRLRRETEALAAKERAQPQAARSETPTAQGPAAFPSSQPPRDKQVARQSLDAAKKDAEADRSRDGADALERAPGASVAAPAPTKPLPAPTAAAGTEAARAAARPDAARSPAAAPSPLATTAPSSALEASPFAKSAPTENAAARPRNEERAASVRAAGAAPSGPLADMLASMAADPDRWSRRAASGESVALESEWRAWLADLDAATATRWRPAGSIGPASEPDRAAADSLNADAARDAGVTTLRLLAAGRLAASVRIDGALAQLETAAPGAAVVRWQATLSPAGAERLRAAARRLPA